MKNLEQILDFLNEREMRATYCAVGEVIGLTPRRVANLLTERTVRNSWVVNAKSLLPTDYEAEQMHPRLERTSLVIQSGSALERGLKVWAAEDKQAA